MMKLKAIKNKKGFTIIEMTIAVVILGMVAVLVGEIYLKGSLSSKTEMIRSKLQIESKNTMEGITSNVKMASKFESTYGTFTASANTLILAVPAVDNTETFLYSGSEKVDDYIVYYLIDSSLHKKVYSTDSRSRLYTQNNIDKVLLTNVKTLNFSYDPELPNTTIVTTDLTVHDTSQKVAEEVSVNSKAKRRNSE